MLSIGVTTSSVGLAIGLGLSMFADTAGAARLLLNVGLVILIIDDQVDSVVAESTTFVVGGNAGLANVCKAQLLELDAHGRFIN